MIEYHNVKYYTVLQHIHYLVEHPHGFLHSKMGEKIAINILCAPLVNGIISAIMIWQLELP